MTTVRVGRGAPDRTSVVASALTQNNLGFLLAKGSQRWNELLRERFVAAGFPEVRPAYGSLLIPLYEEDGLRQGELARRARLSKQTMTTMSPRARARRSRRATRRSLRRARYPDLPHRTRARASAHRRAGAERGGSARYRGAAGAGEGDAEGEPAGDRGPRSTHIEQMGGARPSVEANVLLGTLSARAVRTGSPAAEPDPAARLPPRVRSRLR